MGLMDEAKRMMNDSGDPAEETRDGLLQKADQLEKKAAELRGKAEGYMNQS